MPNPIICGPLVRKVTDNSVSVFIALNEFRRVGLQLSSDPQGAHLIAQTENDPRRIGKKLWVIVLTIKNLSLVSGQNYHYDVSLFNGLDGTTEGLASLGFLDPDNSILGFPLGYEVGHLPGFALPPGLDQLNIIHGSCRKPHGHGPDQLARLDDLIQAGHQDPLSRPHQLFLTGDQIYADDVAEELSEMLSMQGPHLLGIQEPITDTVFLGHIDTQSPNRKQFIDTKTELTSGENDHHLVYLSEFYGMYLFAWSGFPLSLDDLKREHVFKPKIKEIKTGAAGMVSGTIEVESDLTIYAHTLTKVRRALANIPTYMMFDDHEVTDDWYMYGDWKKNALGDAATRRIIRNGLTAYAVFQDWGNQPEKYASALPFWNAVEYREEGTKAVIKAFESSAEAIQLNRFLGLEPNQTALLHNWYYHLSFPEHDLYAIDTRNRRHYIEAYTMLISPAKFEEQMPLPAIPDKLAVVLSPAPVIGMPIIENLQWWAVKQVSHGLATTLDDEAWTGDPLTFNLLLEHLAKYKRTIVLSGDVHYGYTNSCSFFAGTEGDSETARIIQLCSSSLKNGGTISEVPATIDFALHEESFAYYSASVADNAKIVDAIVQENIDRKRKMEDPISIDSYIKLNPRPGSIRIFSHRDLTTYQSVLETAFDLQQTQGRYVVQYLNHDLAEQYNPASYSPDWFKKILGATNIGQVTFESEGNALYVVHQLHCRIRGTNKTFTRRALLTPPNPSEIPNL